LPFPLPSLFWSSPFQLIVVFPSTAIAVAAVVFIALSLPWLSPSPLLLPSNLPSPQLQSSLPPSTPLLPSLLLLTTAATAAVGSKRWLSALALSAGSQRMALARVSQRWLSSHGSHDDGTATTTKTNNDDDDNNEDNDDNNENDNNNDDDDDDIDKDDDNDDDDHDDNNNNNDDNGAAGGGAVVRRTVNVTISQTQ
jgi:hypothetical protein